MHWRQLKSFTVKVNQQRRFVPSEIGGKRPAQIASLFNWLQSVRHFGDALAEVSKFVSSRCREETKPPIQQSVTYYTNFSSNLHRYFESSDSTIVEIKLSTSDTKLFPNGSSNGFCRVTSLCRCSTSSPTETSCCTAKLSSSKKPARTTVLASFARRSTPSSCLSTIRTECHAKLSSRNTIDPESIGWPLVKKSIRWFHRTLNH